MGLTPKTSTYPACSGLGCTQHAQCARWQAVQGSESDPHTMVSCLTGDAYPEFVQAPAVPLAELAAQAGPA